jgi:Flp pilus assembly protein TadG
MKIIRILGGSSGSALVETALTLPMLLAILIGGGELAKVAYVAIEVQNAARAASQYAAMNGGAFNSNDSSGLDTTGMLNAAKADAGNLTSGLAFAATPTFSCSCTGTGTASCTAPSAPSGCTTSHLMVTVTVRMQATYTSALQLPGLPSHYTLYGNSIEQVLQ